MRYNTRAPGYGAMGNARGTILYAGWCGSGGSRIRRPISRGYRRPQAVVGRLLRGCDTRIRRGAVSTSKNAVAFHETSSEQRPISRASHAPEWSADSVNRVRADIPHTTCVLHGLRGFGARSARWKLCAIELLFDGQRKRDRGQHRTRTCPTAGPHFLVYPVGLSPSSPPSLSVQLVRDSATPRPSDRVPAPLPIPRHSSRSRHP